MERLLYRSIAHGHLRNAKKMFASRHVKSFFGMKQMARSQSSFVSQVTSIAPRNDILCLQCLNISKNSLKLLQMTNSFKRQLKVLSSLMSTRPDWFKSRTGWRPENDSLNLFSDKGDLESKLKKMKENLEAEINKIEKELRKEEEKKDGKEANSGKPEDEGKRKDEKEEDENSEMEKRRKIAWITFFQVMLLVWLLMPSSNSSNDMSPNFISWTDFYQNLLTKGEVKSIDLNFHNGQDNEDVAVIRVHKGAIIKGKESTKDYFILKIPNGFNFEEKVREVEDQMGIAYDDRVPIKYNHPSGVLETVFSLVVLLGFMYLARRMMIGASPKQNQKGGKNSMMDMMTGGMRKAKYTRADVAGKSKAGAVSFKDVAGLKEAKVEVIEFISYLTKPDIFKALGAKTPRGALLLGPPGCGKTLLARALATEAKVPFLTMAGSEFVEVIGGVGAARVRDLFKEAREKAPCIIYIDEIDAIGKKRGGGGNMGGGSGEDEHTLNQLLVEMDGMGTQEGVIMLAATNRADILDKALLRPGRFDRHIMIDLPTMIEREEIFTVYLSKLKLAQPPSTYSRPLARLTPGMSGADINNICNEAAIHAGRNKKLHVDKEDFDYAVERVVAGSASKSRGLQPAEKKVVAYHESGHALVGWMLKHTDALLKISIVPRTTNALGFAQYLPSDQKLYSQQELFERMCMALGGRAAESLIFNKISTGAQDDLQRVTKMAYAQIRSYGMNARVGHLSFPSDEESRSFTKPYSQKLATTIDQEARAMVQQAFLHTQKVLEENKDKLDKLAAALLEKEVLDYEDVEALIGPPIHGKKHTIQPQGWV